MRNPRAGRSLTRRIPSPERVGAPSPQPSGPFVLALHALKEGENRWETAGGAVDLDLRPGDATLDSPVSLEARVYRALERVEVQGVLVAACLLTCDRCVEQIRRELRIPVRIYAERRESRDRRSREEVREEDVGIVYHDGRFVDLTDEIRQALLVEIPWHAVCRDDCRGLCPRCGRDRNQQACSCFGGTGDQENGQQGT